MTRAQAVPAAPSELTIQTLFRSRARIQCPAVKIVAIPNAAKRGQRAMNQARREGACWGAPDMVAIWPRGGIAWIEFKTPDGVVRPNQREFHEVLADYGHKIAVCRSPEGALQFLRDCGAPFEEAA